MSRLSIDRPGAPPHLAVEVAEFRRSRFAFSERAGSITAGVLAVVAGLVLWQVLAATHTVASYMLPAPRDVAGTWWAIAQRGVLWHHVSATLLEAVLGFLLAFVVGTGLAYPLSRSRLVAGILSPYIAGTQAMPILALAPILVVWFGFGLSSRVVICALIVFFPILVSTSVGLRTVDRTLIESAQTEGAGAGRILLSIEAPLALRTILAGVRMGLTLSLTGAIVAEFVAADAGLGYLMTLARSEYDTPLLFAAALTMVALAVAGYLLVALIEHLIVDWD